MGSPGCGGGRLSIFSHIFNYYLIHAFYTILPASPSATAAPQRRRTCTPWRSTGSRECRREAHAKVISRVNSSIYNINIIILSIITY